MSMTLLWSVYGNHFTTCAFGLSAEVVEGSSGCTWVVYEKKRGCLEEGSAETVNGAKAEAGACLMGYVYKAEEIV